MSENHTTNFPNQLQNDLEEMASAQQLIQEAVTTTDSLREKLEGIVEHTQEKNLLFEDLLQQNLELLNQIQDAQLDEVKSQLEENLLSFQQEYFQQQQDKNQELVSDLKSVVVVLNSLYEQGENLPAELSLFRNSFTERTKEFNEAIDGVNKTIHNDVMTLNDNQIKFNRDIEQLKENYAKSTSLNTKLLWGLVGGVAVILLFSLILLFKGDGNRAAASQVDDTSELRSKLGLPDNEEEKAENKEDPEELSMLPKNLEPSPAETLESPPILDNSTENVDPPPEDSGSPPETASVPPSESEEEKEEEPIEGMPLPEDAKRIISARANYAVTYLQRKSFSRLALKYFHPEKGIHFYPFGLRAKGYSFTNQEMESVMDNQDEFHWGEIEGNHTVLSFSNYYDKYIFDEDFTDGSQINYNELYASGKSGLSFSQIEEKYPTCIFTEYNKSGKSLILVFEKPEGRKSWYISAIIHNHQ